MDNRGFTIIEVITAIAIIGILVGTVSVNLASSDKNFKLEKKAREIVQKIREAREWAMSLKKYGGSFPASYGFAVQAKGAGSNGKVEIRVNSNTNSNQVIENIDLEDKFEISKVLLNGAQQSGEIIVEFIPPDPKIEIKSSNNATLEFCVNYKNDTSNQFKIYVNTSGLIYIEKSGC